MLNCIQCGKLIDDDAQFGQFIECPSCHELLCDNYPERILMKEGKPMFEFY